jgi:hypothetical protein
VEIPSSLIKKRWTTDARDGVESAIPGLNEAVAARADNTSMHGMLHAAVMELVGMGTTSRQAFEVAVDYVSHAKAAISAMKVDAPVNVGFSVQSTELAGEDVLQFDSGVAAPPRVRSRGRPKELRFKSPIESPGGSKRPTNLKRSMKSSGDDAPRRSTRFLKTGVYVIEHCGSCGLPGHRTSECAEEVEDEQGGAVRRRCKSCGEVGHNRSTCGRKSTYVPKVVLS